MTEHQLKTWPAFFDAIRDGEKSFEVRKNDRGFQKGDVLILNKWDPSPIGDPAQARMEGWAPGAIGYLDDEPLRMRVTYVLSGFGIESGYVAMGIVPDKKVQSAPSGGFKYDSTKGKVKWMKEE